MSVDSLISIPPKLTMIPRSIKKLRNPVNSNSNSYISLKQNLCDSSSAVPQNLIFSSCQTSTLVKLSETSFPLVPERPVNVRIKLTSPEQMFPTMLTRGQFARGYPPSSNAMLFDDDPGIMSEVETSSTGFRRGGKQRSSLPVVRTPSKTLERPLVFLQYRNETKRALLPNEITSIDTVKALFVRSFPKQLSMEYLDSPLVKIYIHDSSKDMFYELEDVRSHLREIRDRSVLRLFESADVSGGLPMGGVGIPGGVGHFEDPSYFSEPEFDSEYQHQHIHKSKVSVVLFMKKLITANYFI
ncbi:hypothetical protein FQA39_LY11792 [Lamprigera yunnana]|nr:hypothetical protein FQA39_LY11792 [Lamprigera yunnana]